MLPLALLNYAQLIQWLLNMTCRKGRFYWFVKKFVSLRCSLDRNVDTGTIWSRWANIFFASEYSGAFHHLNSISRWRNTSFFLLDTLATTGISQEKNANSAKNLNIWGQTVKSVEEVQKKDTIAFQNFVSRDVRIDHTRRFSHLTEMLLHKTT